MRPDSPLGVQEGRLGLTSRAIPHTGAGRRPWYQVASDWTARSEPENFWRIWLQ